jgi:transglutaminase-like putative cysteine protease
MICFIRKKGRKRRSMSWLVLLLAIACNSPTSKTDVTQPTEQVSDLQRMVVTYLVYPQFVHEDFASQALGLPLKVEKYQPSKRMLLASLDSSSFAGSDSLLAICLRPEEITWPTPQPGYLELGPYQIRNRERQYFRFPLSNLRVDSSRKVKVSLGAHGYKASLAELSRIFSGEKLYNGPALVQAGVEDGRPVVIANHCATIVPKGEPSLARLVEQVCTPEASAEQQTQELLDFVSRQIDYTGDAGMEIFRKPSEVLLSGRADCSGKVVLYASLLAQAELPYLLVYVPRHICLAVPGDFPKRNRMHFEHEGQTYFIAETTLPGFQIGSTLLDLPILPEDVEYLQYPGKRTRFYEVATGDSLPFATR